MKSTALFLLGILITISTHASVSSESSIKSENKNDCNNRTINISKLSENFAYVVEFKKSKVYIYKKNLNQIAKAKISVNNGLEGMYPWWWKIKEYPIDPDISLTKSRSLNESIFVFYATTPISAYNITYFSENDNGRNSYSYLKESWEGGFIDIINNVAYDYTGRPVFSDLKNNATQEEHKLSKLSLLVPKYSYNKTSGDLTILCK